MSDLISRQAAIDAIVNCTNCGTPDELRKYVDKHSLENGWTGGVLDAMEAVEDIPAADVVPVVRCRKCKYFWTYQCMDSMPIETCELAQTFYNPDLDFCSLAKRREE